MIAAGMPDPATYEAMGWVIVVCVAIATGVNQVLRLMDRWKDSPAPAEVRAEAAQMFMRREDCNRLHNEFQQQINEIRSQRAADVKDATSSRSGIYNRIEDVRHEMVQMERRLNEGDEKRTDMLQQRINVILEAMGELRGKISKL